MDRNIQCKIIMPVFKEKGQLFLVKDAEFFPLVREIGTRGKFLAVIINFC